MYFSEPFADFRAKLFTDDGQDIDVDFNAATSMWQITVGDYVAPDTLRQMVTYLHGQFYAGEPEVLSDWLGVADSVKREKTTTFTLKTIDRL